MAGKFELYTDAGGKWRFRLKAGNGQVIAVGEAYESKAAAQNGIESIKKNAPDAPVVESDPSDRAVGSIRRPGCCAAVIGRSRAVHPV
jgi:uncharacterized protein YegP (UPF0339 family)